MPPRMPPVSDKTHYGGEIQGVGRDTKEVRYAGERILGYGDLVILKRSNGAADCR